MEASRDRLGSIDERLRGMGGLRSNSPISSGPIIQGPDADSWMHPRDPMTQQGFRAVTESRVFPKHGLLPPLRVPMVPDINRLESQRETVAS